MIKIAIVGLGRVFFCYEEFFKTNKCSEYSVKVVCDIDKDKANAASDSLSCEKTKNFQDVLDRKDIDLVIVLTEWETITYIQASFRI